MLVLKKQKKEKKINKSNITNQVLSITIVDLDIQYNGIRLIGHRTFLEAQGLVGLTLMQTGTTSYPTIDGPNGESIGNEILLFEYFVTFINSWWMC